MRRSATEEVVYDGEMPEDMPFQEGDIVEHASYGRGRVVELRGIGEHLRLKIRFHSVGFKLLVPRHASLRRVP